MKEEVFVERLAVLAGLGTWLVIGVPALLELLGSPALLLTPRWLLWLGAYLGFGFVFALPEDKVKHLSHAPLGLFSLQTLLAALAMAALPGYGFMAILFIITASQAVYVLGVRGAVAWVLGQTVFIGLMMAPLYAEAALAIVQTLAYLGFQLFALLMTHNVIKEAAARQKLAQLNAELRATQELLAESSRIGERVRIARELHDLIGHHLTALSLNLEVAAHLTEGKGQEQVFKARAVAKLLLADVREVVSSMREGNSLDLAAALRALVRDVPKPIIHLSIPDDLELKDVTRAQVILRCVQEVVTNAMKHAGAENLWIDLERTPEGITVRARDDGRGSRRVQAGNGLKGMRERLESLGGRLVVSSSPEQGFSLDAYLPSARG